MTNINKVVKPSVKLKGIREQAKVNEEQLATLLDIPVETYINKENHEEYFTDIEMIALLTFFRINHEKSLEIDDLFF